MPAQLPDFDSLWDYDDPGATEAALRACLKRAGRDADESWQAQLLTQIARTFSMRRRLAEAYETLDHAERLIDAADHVARVRLLLERGRTFNADKRPSEARPLLLEAWELARDADADFYAVDAAHMLAIVESGEAANDWNERAIALAERSADPKAGGWLGSLYNNGAWGLHGLGRFADALAMHEKNLAWQSARGNGAMTFVARWCVARTLRSLGRVEEALALQRDLLISHKAAGSDDGYVHEELGECLLALGRADEAAPPFARAFELLSRDSAFVADESERMARLKRLSGRA